MHFSLVSHISTSSNMASPFTSFSSFLTTSIGVITWSVHLFPHILFTHLEHANGWVVDIYFNLNYWGLLLNSCVYAHSPSVPFCNACDPFQVMEGGLIPLKSQRRNESKTFPCIL